MTDQLFDPAAPPLEIPEGSQWQRDEEPRVIGTVDRVDYATGTVQLRAGTPDRFSSGLAHEFPRGWTRIDDAPTGQIRAHRDPEASAAKQTAALAQVTENRGSDVDLCEAAARRLVDRRSIDWKRGAIAPLPDALEFTTDDVWMELGDDAQPMPEPRAMGPAMKRLGKDRLIENTHRVTPCTRPSRNGGNVTVWRILL